MFGITESLSRRINGRDKHFVFINWKCNVVKGEPVLNNDEFTEMTWMPIEQALKDEKVTESVRHTLKKMIERG